MVAFVIYWILLAFLLCIWVRVILSYVSFSPVGALATLNRGAWAVTEPILGPVRKLLPSARVGSSALDLSPIVVSIVIIIIIGLI